MKNFDLSFLIRSLNYKNEVTLKMQCFPSVALLIFGAYSLPIGGYDSYITSLNSAHQKRQDLQVQKPLVYVPSLPVPSNSQTSPATSQKTPKEEKGDIKSKKKASSLASKKSSENKIVEATSNKALDSKENNERDTQTPTIVQDVDVEVLKGDVPVADQLQTPHPYANLSYTQNILRAYFKLTLSTDIVQRKDWDSFCMFLSQTKPIMNQADYASRGLNYGIFNFDNMGNPYIWIHYTLNESQGYFAILNKNLEIIYISTNVGSFDSCRAINLFKTNQNVLVLTHALSNTHKSPGTEEKEKSTNFYILDKDGLVQLNIVYVPTGEITLHNDYDPSLPQGLSQAGEKVWIRSRVKCQSSLELSQKQPNHGLLQTTQTLDLHNDGETLNQEDLKIIRETLDKKFSIKLEEPKIKSEKWKWSDKEKMFVQIDPSTEEKFVCPPTQLFYPLPQDIGSSSTP